MPRLADRFRMPVQRGKETYEERFWRKVQFDPICWEWQGSFTPAGYGQCWVERDLILCHRASWTLLRGEIPDGLCVCHTCDNRKCVKPEHLFLGTKGDNARDAAAKGRSTSQVHPELFRGELASRAKLTESDVREIRRAYAAGEIRASLARRYGVGHAQISNIVYRRSGGWVHVL